MVCWSVLTPEWDEQSWHSSSVSQALKNLNKLLGTSWHSLFGIQNLSAKSWYFQSISELGVPVMEFHLYPILSWAGRNFHHHWIPKPISFGGLPGGPRVARMLSRGSHNGRTQRGELRLQLDIQVVLLIDTNWLLEYYWIQVTNWLLIIQLVTWIQWAMGLIACWLIIL